jgi:hypothetical protein
MIRWIVFVALLISSSFACVGCGGSFWKIPDCLPDPNDPFSCPDTPAPTITDDPSPPQPTLPPGCVDDAYLLYPSGNTVPSNYSDTMYLTVPDGETPGSFLELYVGQTNPANQVAQFEAGTPLVSVPSPPSFVAPPPTGFTGVYSSSNLPLMPTWGTVISLVDTRNPGFCYAITFATLNTKGVRRTTHVGRSLRRL